ncbi:hypothetical protein GMRT_15562 [Giardia muris]|uniref:Uncharacterized protein n=1 Tax=Giardia muris TaxID=5742 RepID=A0A4Z1SSG7_GIAMU|nr:hypothetical protein GMRT_15562 [Giardia muris]|eukprot:TNJ28846.1 hypothetical protein GMRT_15562 [Giardia muris]
MFFGNCPTEPQKISGTGVGLSASEAMEQQLRVFREDVRALLDKHLSETIRFFSSRDSALSQTLSRVEERLERTEAAVDTALRELQSVKAAVDALSSSISGMQVEIKASKVSAYQSPMVDLRESGPRVTRTQAYLESPEETTPSLVNIICHRPRGS